MSEATARVQQIRMANSPVFWCIEQNPTDILEVLFADSSITDGLAVTLERSGKQTVSRDDACKLVGRLAALGHAEPPLSCADCSNTAAVEADVAVFLQSRQTSQESSAA